MIFYGVGMTYFLCGVATALLVLAVPLAILAWIVERKTKERRDELERQRDELEGK